MKKIVYILSIILFSNCNNVAQKTDAKVENIDALKFKQLTESGNGIILDVRTPEEVADGFIPGASTVDYYDSNFRKKINYMQKDKDIYVYCKAGGRSSEAAELLVKDGFKNVYNLEGGIIAWEKKGFSLTKPDLKSDKNIKQFTLSEFNNLLKTNQPVLVDFHTKWCVPCKKMAPLVDELEIEYKNKALIIRVDIDNSKEVANHYQIQGIPVFILFKNGTQKWRHNGIIKKEDLQKQLEEND